MSHGYGDDEAILQVSLRKTSAPGSTYEASENVVYRVDLIYPESEKNRYSKLTASYYLRCGHEYLLTTD